jgi:hypothetical protein
VEEAQAVVVLAAHLELLTQAVVAVVLEILAAALFLAQAAQVS